MAIMDVLDLVLSLVDLGTTAGGNRASRAVRRWFRRRAAKSWPSAQAIMSTGRVEESQGSYFALAPYTFFAAGDRYAGEYKGEFASESEATEALERLKATPPSVRYKPGRPDVSVLTEN